MSERAYISFAEVKERVGILDALRVLGLAERFRKEGKTYAGVCPLPAHTHGPSPNDSQFKIAVKDSVSLFHCFGDCQRGGDVIEFVKLMTGLDNQHVRFWFAEHFGDRLSLARSGEAKVRSRGSPRETKEAGDAVQERSPADTEVSTTKVSSGDGEYKPIRFNLQLDHDVPYLRGRGLTDETIARYGLGLAKRGMLNGYVAIPIWDYPKGRHPLGYIGRWPGEDFEADQGKPRYKLPPNFPKHRVLYGLAEALETPDDQPLIVVEGVLGALHCVQAGFPATVATLGSTLGDEQGHLLRQTGRPIILMFDGDEAGLTGMRKAASQLIASSFVHISRLEPGQQPDALTPDQLRSVLSLAIG